MASTGAVSGGLPFKFGPMLQDDGHAVRALNTRHGARHKVLVRREVPAPSWRQGLGRLAPARSGASEGPRLPNQIWMCPPQCTHFTSIRARDKGSVEARARSQPPRSSRKLIIPLKTSPIAALQLHPAHPRRCPAPELFFKRGFPRLPHPETPAQNRKAQPSRRRGGDPQRPRARGPFPDCAGRRGCPYHHSADGRSSSRCSSPLSTWSPPPLTRNRRPHYRGSHWV